MAKTIPILLSIIGLFLVEFPEIKVAGAMRNIMMKGDLSTRFDLDTMSSSNLYGLGPVANLKGEMLIADGEVFTSERSVNQAINKKGEIKKAAMLVYSYVKHWKTEVTEVSIINYADLEKFIERKATTHQLSIPFVFKIEASPQSVQYHIIDWIKGETHTMENHKQFALNGAFKHTKVLLLGFYSDRHHSIFTHHSTNMHVHVMDKQTQTVGHLDNIQLNGSITLFFPEK